MEFVLRARPNDWHVTRADGQSGVWSAARTVGEALRLMLCNAHAHDWQVNSFDVLLAPNAWTSRVIAEPRLLSTTDIPWEVVVEDDVEYLFYFVRHTWTDELMFICRCRPGYHPVWPMKMPCRSERVDQYDFDQMEAFGVAHANTIPDKWCGPVPKLSVPMI